MEAPPKRCDLTLSQPEQGTLLIGFSGSWKIGQAFPSLEGVKEQIDSSPRTQRIAYDTRQLEEWDTTFLTFLIKVRTLGARHHISINEGGLPRGVRRLLNLATAVPESTDERSKGGGQSMLTRIGRASIASYHATIETFEFIGEILLAFVDLLRGKAQFRPSELIRIIQECGAQALPIVSLISVLVGLILAFIGAIQLKMFGAEIFVANLVGIAMVRVMGAIMTGIIMAGRTGAAFAAQIGTMQVNEEIDALRTMGVSPMEYLVLPRMLAMVLMMPLLCLYANIMGILGGFIVSVGMLDLNATAYYNQTCQAVRLNDLWIGLFHSVVFGALVAMAGCLRGMQCGRSASAVGAAATSAVVTGIVSIIVATGIITVLCDVLGI